MHDPYLYLEEAHSKQSVAWAQKQTAKAVSALNATSSYAALHADACTILGNKDKTVFAGISEDNFAYHFQTNDDYPLGCLRRMPVKDYENKSDDWDILLDIAALVKAEGTNWNLSNSCLSPNKKRLMLKLSPDGGDATVVREFDIATKSFTNDGLDIELGKTNFAYIDDDTLLMASNCDGEMTESGYAEDMRIVKRGIKYQDTQILMRIEKTDILVAPLIGRGEKNSYVHKFVYIRNTFWTSSMYHIGAEDKLTKLNLPEKLKLSGMNKTHIFLHLEEDWVVNIPAKVHANFGVVESTITFKTGDIVSVHLAKLIKGKLDVQIVYRAPKGCITEEFKVLNTRTAIISQMKDVCGELLILKKQSSTWHVNHKIPLPENGSVDIGHYMKNRQNLIVSYADSLTPYTEYMYNLKTRTLKAVKSQKSHFDNESMQVTQQFSTSVDGTKIPYFIMHKKGLKLNGQNPTILYGYGGFNINLTPHFSNLTGKLWLEHGGVYVIANIRGGAEYGPTWHTSVLKQNRHKCYEDFESVAEKLIADKVTSSAHLGISGGSNGGLLVGACVTRRPELFGAVSCAVPLLDMIRLEHIGAGASWIGEYGKPSDSPEMESYLRGYSPYHNVKADVNYPRIYFTASQADDRTHPCHARKMVALMNDQGHDVLYNEMVEGGHTGGADISKQAEKYALEYSYFFSELS